MGNQLRVAVYVPNAPLYSLLVENETMKRRDMEERPRVLVLVRLIPIMIITSSLTHSLPTASSGLPFKSSLYLLSFRDSECITPPSL
jgi:hypothetical protein